jgi:hypothetical protein
MSTFTLAESQMGSAVTNKALSFYQFGTHQAKHYFCQHCGIFPFHQSMHTKNGETQYRLNLGCIEGLEIQTLETSVFDGTKL